jgi:hypothetical protein
MVLSPYWICIQDGGLDILNALSQYGYQLKGLVLNNSNPLWRQIQDGGLDILNEPLQYRYQLKGLVMNNSKKKTTSLLIQYGELLKLKTLFEAEMFY